MVRPLRIEFAGALYHITCRGNERREIFFTEEDRSAFLGILGDVGRRCNWLCHAYCLMRNHYHLLVETPEANLSQGMQHLNGVYTQYINRTHRSVGPLFQGRFKGILVQKPTCWDWPATLYSIRYLRAWQPIRKTGHGVVTGVLWAWKEGRSF